MIGVEQWAEIRRLCWDPHQHRHPPSTTRRRRLPRLGSQPKPHLGFKDGIKVTDDDTNHDNEMTSERAAA